MPSWMELEQQGNHPQHTRGMVAQAQKRRAEQMYKSEKAQARKARALLNKLSRAKTLELQRKLKTYRAYEYDKLRELDKLRLEAEARQEYKKNYKDFYEDEIRKGTMPSEPQLYPEDYLRKIYEIKEQTLPLKLKRLEQELQLSRPTPLQRQKQQQIKQTLGEPEIEELSTKKHGQSKMTDYATQEKPKVTELPPPKQASFTKKASSSLGKQKKSGQKKLPDLFKKK